MAGEHTQETTELLQALIRNQCVNDGTPDSGNETRNSDLLRTYLEERFALRAPERTTEEFLRELEGGEALAKSHRAELERFLLQCDLVKFAAFQPGEADHLTTWALAEAFVEATRGDRAVAEAVA